MTENITNMTENISLTSGTAGPGDELSAKITKQGDIVRTLKTDKKPKEEIDAAVQVLLSLKVMLNHVINLVMNLVINQINKVWLTESVNYLKVFLRCHSQIR